MSSAAPFADLLASLAAQGIELWYEGDRLRFHAPKGALDAVQRERVSSQRSGILAALRAAAGARSEELALSFPQFMMWFQHQQAPLSTVCTVGLPLRATGQLNVGALRHAVQALVDRHPMLRTTYHLRDGVPVQRIAGGGRATLDVQACDARNAAEHTVSAQIAAHVALPFDLETGPLFRVVLFTDGAAEHTVLVTFHHIAADGWAGKILISELLSLYEEAAENRPPGLARPPLGYEDFVRWQTAEVHGANGERQWSYWRRILAAPRQRSVLPTDVVRPPMPRFVGDSVRSDLPAALVQQVQALAARLRTTPFVVLLGAFQLLLARLCGVRDVVTGMPVLGRPKADYLSVVGNFVNVLPVRSRLEETAAVSEFLAGLHATVVSALEAQDYPLARMVQQLHLSGEETGQALFNTSFTLLTPEAVGITAGRAAAGTTFALQPLALQAGLLDLGMDIVVGDAGMHCIFKYSLDVLTAAAAAGFAQRYAAMIDALTGPADPALADLLGTSTSATASDDERAALLLDALAARDIVLAVDGERLRVNAPKGALDESARKAIAAQRPAIIARLRAASAEGAARDFWHAQLEGVPALLALPTDRPRADRRPGPHSELRVLLLTMPEILLERLRVVGETRDASLFMTLMAAWQVLLHRYSGQDEVVVATAGADGTAGLERAIPIRGHLEGNPAFDRFLAQIRRTVLAVQEHPAPPLTRCQAGFNLYSSVAAEGCDWPRRDHTLDVMLEITALPRHAGHGAAQCGYRFAADLFDADTIGRLHENLCTLVEAITADPGAAILDLDLLGPTERRRALDDGAGADLAHDRTRCVHQLLEESARRHPERLAVSGPGGDMRYGELDSGANQLAQFLLRAGLRRGATVAVCLERTASLPLALAAVLKAGGAYVPLDPTHPRERLRGILRDAHAAVFITQDGFEDIAQDTTTRVIRLDADAAAIEACPGGSPGVAVSPEDLAYVIYTSGSTGRPKGVEVEHRNVVAFLEAMRHRPGLHADDVLLAVTTVAFDIAGLEIWLPLSVGARIVLAARAEVVDAAVLVPLLEAQSVTVMQATPATWRLLLDSGWVGRTALRALCGGEALPHAVAARLVGRVGELWNLYGPTETTIWSTAAHVAVAAEDGTGLIPIGRPIANTIVRIEDRSGRSVPAGVVGELLIGGEGVARGYRDQPELTAGAFVTRSNGAAMLRFYRTGDLARFRADGQLEFFGRRDHQIKLRGHRIEPGEIEALLAGHGGVTGCVVIAHAMADDERLVAYLTLAADALFDPGALRSALRARLPDYMVPGHFVVLPVLPLTPNGKIDRAALPPPGATQADAGATGEPSIPAVAMTSAQHRVAVLWKEVLRVARVGLDDNFFDIGGHSLLLVKIHARLKREFGCEMPLVELFQHTTVAQQARALEIKSHA